VSPLTDDVCIGGARIARGDESRYWAGALAGPRAHCYRARDVARPGAFILPADAPRGYGDRDKLVWIGRKHKRV